jgi:DNA repair exonuclease SbcCD ATPase subunit
MKKDKQIAELKTQISFERDINAGRENQLEQDIKHLRGVIDERGDLIVIAEQRKEIAELKEELEKKAETIADLKRDNKYFRKELVFWKGYVTGDDHDYEYDSLA